MDERPQSEFNMALSYLNRINSLFYVCDESSISLDFYTWYHALITLFRELSTEMKDEELDDHEKSFDEVLPLVTQHLNQSQRRGRNEVSIDLHRKLHRIEIRLRRVMKESGLQMKMADDASLALR